MKVKLAWNQYIGTDGQTHTRRIRIGRFIQDKKISEVELYISRDCPGIEIKKEKR